jgi:hypothetical protein
MVVKYYFRHDIGWKGVVAYTWLCVNHRYDIKLVESDLIDRSEIKIQIAYKRSVFGTTYRSTVCDRTLHIRQGVDKLAQGDGSRDGVGVGVVLHNN